MDFLKAATEIFHNAIENLDSISNTAQFDDQEQYAGIIDAAQVVMAYTSVQEQRTANLIAAYAAFNTLNPGESHTLASDDMLATIRDEIKARLGLTATADA